MSAATADGEDPAGPVVERTSGPAPLHLPRVVAEVTCPCARCGGSDRHAVVVAADWWDREAVLRQRAQVTGLPCPRCGAPVEPPVPVLQLRRMDAADLLVGLPPSTAVDDDNRWLAAAVRALRPLLPAEPRIVSMRADWWPHLDALPLGPVLAGLADLPADIPDDADARRLWLRDTRAVVGVPAVQEAVNRFVTAADDPTGEAAVVAAEPCLVDPGWRSAVTAAGARLAAHQETAEQREFVAERLERLNRVATDGDAGVDAALPPDEAAAVDRAVDADVRDPRRLAGLEELVALLAPRGPSTTLSRAMTSLVASRMAAPGRAVGDADALEQLARDSVALAEQVFGPDHRITLSNRLNLLVARQERGDLTDADVATLAADYADLARNPAVHRTGWLVDVLINMSVSAERRPDLSRGDRQELVLRILDDAAHVAALTRPDDPRIRVFCLANQAAVLRQRVAGAKRANIEQALARLDEAHRLDTGHDVLHPVERIQLAVNRLNTLVTSLVVGARDGAAEQVAAAAAEVAGLADTVHEQHDMAVRALGGAGSVLLELHGRGVRAGHPDPALWRLAEPLVTEASRRADALYAPGSPTRLTARLNLAGLYGTTVDGAVADEDACARLLQEVAAEAAGRSAEHEATAWSNLAGLRLQQRRWDEAADGYRRARAARRAMVEGSATRHTMLGEVIATGDLAVREALVHVRRRRLDVAVETLEDGRGTLLRHRRAVPDGPVPVPDDPARAVVYLASCDSGTFGVVRSHGRADRGFVSELTAGALRAGLRDLVTAPTRMRRMLAVRHAEDMLGELAGVVAVLAGDEITDLCVVACGPLAGAPLHAARDRTGLTWLDRWPVRFWPSARMAASLHPPRLDGGGTAVAVAGEEHDLPLAASELAAVGRLAATVEIPPPGWQVQAWLRGALRRAGVAHFACHARSDLLDPTGSSFDFGAGGRLTVADLLDWTDVDGLEMVVASACQAGVPATEAPDEFLGIGFGLLHAGAQSVVSPLWEVNDTPAALLMARLYHELGRGREPAEALRRAQTWVRDVDNAALVAAAGADRLPGALAAHLVAQLGDADPGDRPFRHPVDWAAFTYLGA